MRSSSTPSLAALASAALVSLAALSACNTGPAEPEAPPAPATGKAVAAEPAPAPAPEPAPAAAPAAAAAPATAGLRFGQPIEGAAQKIALSDVAKNPSAFVGKKFATTGTVTAVCQHMGCWMEVKDDASQAHIKMAGHSFFVPKSASGRKVRVLATLVKGQAPEACAGEGHDTMAAAGHAPKNGCRAEAEAQLGRPLAKLELLAEGVELL